MSTSVLAQANETVCGLLYRVLGDDSDDMVEAFFQLNPTQKTLFLDPLQDVALPERQEVAKKEAAPVHVLEIWE